MARSLENEPGNWYVMPTKAMKLVKSMRELRELESGNLQSEHKQVCDSVHIAQANISQLLLVGCLGERPLSRRWQLDSGFQLDDGLEGYLISTTAR